MTRLVSADGSISKGRRYASGSSYVTPEDAKDPDRLATLIAALQARVGAVEARVGGSAIEFDVECPEGGEIVLAHGFSGPIRWYVTSWRRDTNPGVYSLAEIESPQDGILKLYSETPGQAVIRIETAQAGQALRQASAADTAQTLTGGGSIDGGDITSGVVDPEFGGTGLDMSGSTGLVKVTAGTFSTVTAPSGAVVGDTDTQTLSAKTLTSPEVNTELNYGGSTSKFDGKMVWGHLTSAGGNVTEVIKEIYTLPTECSAQVFAIVTGTRTSDGAAVNGYTLSATFKNDSGTETIIGTQTQHHIQEELASFNCTLTITSSGVINCNAVGYGGAPVMDWSMFGIIVVSKIA